MRDPVSARATLGTAPWVSIKPYSTVWPSGSGNETGVQVCPAREPGCEASADAGLPKGGAFPRYLANAFAEEGKREIKKQRPETASPQNATDEHQVESVTSHIREKLREMKPHA